MNVTLIAQEEKDKDKRLLLQGDFACFPAFQGPTANNRGGSATQLFNDQEESFVLNTRFGGQLSYSFNPHLSTYISYGYFNSAITLAYTSNNLIFTDSINYHNVFYDLHASVLATGVDYFVGKKRQSTLSHGTYLKFGLAIVFGKAKDIDHMISYPEPFKGYDNQLIYELTSEPELKLKFTHLALHLAVQQRFVLYKRLTLNVGIESYLLPAWFIADTKNINNPISDEEIQVYYQTKIVNRLQRHLLFNLNLGLGVLIF